MSAPPRRPGHLGGEPSTPEAEEALRRAYATNSPIAALRAELVTAARAHARRAEAYDPAQIEEGEEMPPWLEDAYRGSVMAAVYAEALACALGYFEDFGDPNERASLASEIGNLLENGVEDENADVTP